MKLNFEFTQGIVGKKRQLNRCPPSYSKQFTAPDKTLIGQHYSTINYRGALYDNDSWSTTAITLLLPQIDYQHNPQYPCNANATTLLHHQCATKNIPHIYCEDYYK